MSDDLDMLAAEYVLGTLDAAERAGFERRLAVSEPARRALKSGAAALVRLLSQPATSSLRPICGTGSRRKSHHKAELTAELRRQSRRMTIVSTRFSGPREGGDARL